MKHGRKALVVGRSPFVPNCLMTTPAVDCWLNHVVLDGRTALVFVVASLDEFNQSFNPLRTGSPWDVAIDIIGGAVSIFMCFLLARKKPRRPF